VRGALRSAVALALVVGLFGCGGAPDASANPECNIDNNCEAGRFCCAKECLPNGSLCHDQVDATGSSDADVDPTVDTATTTPDTTSATHVDTTAAETSTTTDTTPFDSSTGTAVWGSAKWGTATW